ncbi:MAG: dTDP-4-amino-4,6-dideoxygalactose transaminase [Ruminiclostridium sp.]|nr:dTDP-4-amino-4,6-dideoxygalactose transaminase [Ruminiclostridium sp.]
MIPFNIPPLTGKEPEYVQKAIASRKICGDGEFCLKCTKWFADTYETPVLLTPSCTHALEMAAILCGIKEGDEVILPSYTFASTADAFVMRGARLVFVDIRPDTMNIDETLIEEAVTSETKAIAVMHYGGVACEMEKINDITHRHGLYVVEDSAQCAMARYKGRLLGTLGDYGCLSFHETKNFSMGEGGAIIINRADDLERAEIIREKGTDRSRFYRGQIDKYTWRDAGSSYLPNEFGCAYLYAQLELAEKITAERVRLADTYRERLSELEKRGDAEFQRIPGYCEPNGHLFYIKTENLEVRTRLIAFLRDKGIIAPFHYVPLHSAPAGQKYGRFSGEDRYTTRESSRLVRLPMYYGLTESDQSFVCECVNEFFGIGGTK